MKANLYKGQSKRRSYVRRTKSGRAKPFQIRLTYQVQIRTDSNPSVSKLAISKLAISKPSISKLSFEIVRLAAALNLIALADENKGDSGGHHNNQQAR